MNGFAVCREQDEVVITSAEGVTCQHTLAEQRNLVQNYPTGTAPVPPTADPKP